MNRETIFIILFVIAMAVAIGVRRLRVPYTVALVLAGLLLGWGHVLPSPELTKSLLFSIFLPGLVFEAAFHIEIESLTRNRMTITSLAVPGVVASMALISMAMPPVASALEIAHGFGWRHALVFGALISATDPIAVIAIFRTLGVPNRLAVSLEGESLLNDGTSIVLFTLSLSLLAGATVTAGGLALQFIEIVGMGVVIGVAVGFGASILIRHVDDPMIEITLTTIAAYGSFVAAEQLHYSGVIATAAAGLVCGSYGARTGMSAASRVASETFWEYVAFALNSIVFLLIGLEVRLESLLSSWLPIVVAYVVVTLGRGLVILAGWSAMRWTRERFPFSWSVVLTWGGLRGALPMVLALSLPRTFEYRELLVSMTFGVVILSILLQGLSMSPVLRWLGIMREEEERTAWETKQGRARAAAAALEELSRMKARRWVSAEVIEELREHYEQAIEQAESEMSELDVDQAAIREDERNRARRQLLMVEKRSVTEAYQQGVIGRRAHEQMQADVDAELLRLEAGEDEDAEGASSEPEGAQNEGSRPGEARG